MMMTMMMMTIVLITSSFLHHEMIASSPQVVGGCVGLAMPSLDALRTRLHATQQVGVGGKNSHLPCLFHMENH
jgi:hypothetical protein